MRFWSRWGIAAMVFFSVAAPARAEKKIWQYEGGKWPQVRAEQGEPPAEPTLDKAEQYLAHGDWKSARDILLDWERGHKDSTVRDRCVYLLAEAYFQGDDRILSFYYLDEVMDEYPESRLFYPAVEKQFEIADAFLNGYRRKFLWLHILPSEDEGVEMMYRIQQRSPGSPLAERALLKTADYYFNDSQFDLAADAYAAFARSYPRSPEVPRVKMRQAFSALAQFRGLKYDATAIIDARAELVDIEKNYPKLADEENVASVIDQIDSAFAGKLYETGDFYRRTNDPRAAAYTWRYLVNTYPRSPDAAKARVQLARLPKSAFNTPEPPAGSGYGPATLPSADAR